MEPLIVRHSDREGWPNDGEGSVGLEKADPHDDESGSEPGAKGPGQEWSHEPDRTGCGGRLQ